MSRPSILRFLGATVTMLGVCLGVGWTGCATQIQARGSMARFEFEQPQMGGPFRMVIYGGDSNRVQQAAAAAFARVAALNQILSDYETDSEVSELSDTAGQGRAVPVSAELWTVLERAQALAQISGGAFDVTAGRVISLWRRARRTKTLPAKERLEEALRTVGYREVVMNRSGRTVTLNRPGVKLDFGGIAKGYAIDEAMAMLRRSGFTRCLVAASGDILVGAPPPGESGWRIEIEAYDGSAGPTRRFLSLRHRAVSTSGDASQRLELGGIRYSHIVDPKTGVGLTNHSLVTVIARDGLTADSVATAASVLGSGRGQALSRFAPAVEIRWVEETGAGVAVRETSRFSRYLGPGPK